MTDLTPSDLENITERERIALNDAVREFRFYRPGDRMLIEKPMRDAAGTLREVQYVWADAPGRTVGKAVRQPDGHFAVEIF
jgi:hypothetical protein